MTAVAGIVQAGRRCHEEHRLTGDEGPQPIVEFRVDLTHVLLLTR
jgi:hypothetical protein